MTQIITTDYVVFIFNHLQQTPGWIVSVITQELFLWDLIALLFSDRATNNLFVNIWHYCWGLLCQAVTDLQFFVPLFTWDILFQFLHDLHSDISLMRFWSMILLRTLLLVYHKLCNLIRPVLFCHSLLWVCRYDFEPFWVFKREKGSWDRKCVIISMNKKEFCLRGKTFMETLKVKQNDLF